MAKSWIKRKWTPSVGTMLDIVGVPGVMDDGRVWWSWVSFAFEYELAWLMIGAGTALIGGYLVAHAHERITLSGAVAFSPWLFIPRHPPMREFNVPILDAIRHLLESPHSYTRSDWAERNAFTMIHRDALCTGRLPVIGRETDFSAPRRISAWECRRLDAIEVVVMPSPAAPDGVRFVLVEPTTGDPDKDADRLHLRDLRVRSRDLYRIWPK